MSEQNNQFLPEQVDEQVEALSQAQIETKHEPSSNTRLVANLHQIYQEEAEIGEQVWARLAGYVVEQRASGALPPESAPAPGTFKAVSKQPLRFTRSEGIKKMRFTDQPEHTLLSENQQPAFWEQREYAAKRPNIPQMERTRPFPKRLPRLLSLAAAVLVSVALIGGMALVFAARNNGPTTSTTTGTAGASATATATSQIPPECRDLQDQADETLCAQHQETNLNITKNFSGHIITFVRAYADTSRLMLIYTTRDSPQSDTISFMNVTIQQGIKLGGGGGLQIVYTNPTTHGWYYLVSFETRDVPTGTTTLSVESITDAFSGTATPLHFTTPFHAVPFNATLKTVSVKQTVTSKGVALTLDHLAFTLGGTFIYLKSSESANTDVYLNSLSINGQRVASSKDTVGGEEPLVIHISLPLQGKPGAWVVQIMAGISADPTSGATWTFHFIVSDTK